VVDMRSRTGRLVILGHDNLRINTIETDPRNTGHPYVDIRIPDCCICEVQGYAAIFFYCHIMSKTPDPAKDAASAPQSSNSPSIIAPPAARAPEIIIRIQVHPSGRLSAPYHKDVMHPKVTTTEFFNWFSTKLPANPHQLARRPRASYALRHLPDCRLRSKMPCRFRNQGFSPKAMKDISCLYGN
jgi:hypothetical protein